MPTYTESYAGKINRKLLKKQRIIAVAAGREPADLVLKNATYLNVFSNELCMMGTPLMILKAVVTAFVGIYCLCCALECYYKKKLNVVQIVLMLAASLLLIDSDTITDLIGLACAALVVVPNYISVKRAAA